MRVGNRTNKFNNWKIEALVLYEWKQQTGSENVMICKTKILYPSH